MKRCETCDNTRDFPDDSLDLAEVHDSERCERCSFYSEWREKFGVVIE